MNRTKSFTLILVALADVIFNQCQTENNKINQKLLLNEAQNWFESYSIKNSNVTPSNDKSIYELNTATIKKELFWDKAEVHKILDKDIVIVPVWYENKYRMGKQAIRQIWIYKNETKEFESKVIELLATPQYMKAHATIKYKDFTGSITIHDWHKGFQGGYQIENGKKIGNVIDYGIGNKKNVGISNTVTRTTADCGYQTTQSYYEPQCNCVGFQVTWKFVDCGFTNYFGLGGYDYFSWVESNYACESFGTCQNHDTNYYPEPDPVDYEKQGRDDFNYNKIDDSKLKPCMQSILYSLKGLTNGSVAQIIQTFSGAVPGYNWEVKDGSLPPSINASTSTIFNTSSGTVTTIFDASKFTNSTDLSIARTILHESIHAYVVAVTYNTLTDSAQRKQLLGSDWLSVFLNYGHDYITTTYLTPMVSALLEYSGNKDYDVTWLYCNDLAWGGLTNQIMKDSQGKIITDADGKPKYEETVLFKAAFPNPSDRSRVKSTINTELGIINSTHQKGKNAGC